MVRCIVKCCKNTRKTCTTEQVSFFQLPENAIIREGWIKRIGEIYLPTNIKRAKICSVHFTEDSFLKNKDPKKNKDRSDIRRRNLIPSAVPTLFLSPMENSQQLDDAICRTPPSSYNAYDYEHSITFPRRSQRKKNITCCQNILHTSTVLARKIPSRTASKRGIEVASEQIRESVSEEGTPWKRKQQFMMENCSNNINVHKSTTNDDPNVTINWLKAELQHHRSIGEFHVLSKLSGFEDQRSIQQECDALKLQLLQKDDCIKNLMRENEELKTALYDLRHSMSIKIFCKNCPKSR